MYAMLCSAMLCYTVLWCAVLCYTLAPTISATVTRPCRNGANKDRDRDKDKDKDKKPGTENLTAQRFGKLENWWFHIQKIYFVCACGGLWTLEDARNEMMSTDE